MKALILSDQTASKIQIVEVAKPTLTSNQVLLRIKAASLNRRDQWMREDKYPGIKYGVIMGSDACGVIEEVGNESLKNWIGKEVIINPNINWGDDLRVQAKQYSILGMPSNGTLTEYIAVSPDRLHEKPQHLTVEQASALPLGGLTAYRAVFTQGKVKKGDKVLISGVGGGVNQFAFQFALAAGAEVYATSGDDLKLQKSVKYGAKAVFNYKNPDWMKEAQQKAGGFDVVIDSAGGDQINTFVKLMRPAGRIVFFGATNGVPKTLDLHRMFWNQITLQGSTMGNDQEFAEMVQFVSKHKIVPIIDSLAPLEMAESAFNKMRDGRQFGKLVLVI
ncbi:zinc-binding dehydrogenase [Cytophagales bacterium LB-30]|uniref:Zinc-binding dehydrogenase n=1 Tax=Shiella aurantiaca TaxID=3058365 RepID=A0ABT8F1Q5_9BACT|nr:zinc-binding dehydrogenase [Shiella aurantiaca]MDN4164169.1 zinc-binding dehydrogenase [Shiella aurantiaca]